MSDTKINKKIEWSKVVTGLIIIFFAVYGIWCGIEYYQLCRIAIENDSTQPDSTLAVTCVSMILASILSYLLYQGALKLSLNKNRLTIDNVTGVVRSISEGNFLEAIDNTETIEEPLETDTEE